MRPDDFTGPPRAANSAGSGVGLLSRRAISVHSRYALIKVVQHSTYGVAIDTPFFFSGTLVRFCTSRPRSIIAAVIDHLLPVK